MFHWGIIHVKYICLRYTMLLFDVCIYCQMITIKSLVNIVTIHSYTFCVCVIRIFKIYSLSSLWEGNGKPLSTLAWKIPWTEEPVVHGVAECQTWLSDFTFTFHFHALEKEMAAHSSVLAWRIPGRGGAWWAALYGVAQSRTRLKWLSSSSSSSSL